MRTIIGLLVLSLAVCPAASVAADAGSKSLVYFGTYTGPVSKGIYVADFDSATGKLGAPRLAGEIERPSWVTLHPNHRYLYAVTRAYASDPRSLVGRP
jgi:6-phosphogluconolactonase